METHRIYSLFAHTDIDNAPVIDEHRIEGVISTSDLVRALVADSEE